MIKFFYVNVMVIEWSCAIIFKLSIEIVRLLRKILTKVEI